MLKILSAGMRKIPHLEAFLAEEFKRFNDPQKVEAVAGWGHKQTATEARALAVKLDVPYIAVEDGFLRSLSLGAEGAQPLSLSVDPRGCYYNASVPSQIEVLLKDPSWFDEDLRTRALSLLKFMRERGLSKYNSGADAAVLKLPEGEKRVLIADQTLGDASLELGRAPNQGMNMMIKEASRLYPDHKIYIKVHPEVIAGKKNSLLSQVKLPKEVELIAADVEPRSLLANFAALFTVTSQMGFDALIQGVKVYCIGMPFYAGWGLTHDFQLHERRRAVKGVTLELLFAAAMFKLCRYVNPVSGARCEPEEIASLLALQKELNCRNEGLFVACGFKRYKHRIVRAYFQGSRSRVVFAKNTSDALTRLSNSKGRRTLVQWASKANLRLTRQAEKRGCSVMFMEDGFIRSKGLGSNHELPFSLVCDSQGIYYRSALKSDLEVILNNLHQREDLPELKGRAGKLLEYIRKEHISKYNVGDEKGFEYLRLEEALAQNAQKSEAERRSPVILVPGQVENDASVLSSPGSIRTNVALLKAVREDHPGAFIIYKPHPDVVAGNRPGSRGVKFYEIADFVVVNTNIVSLFKLVDEVHVLTSQTGFEALCYAKKVKVYGAPFYAGWGLTDDVLTFGRRNAYLSLEELAAGVLILYPRYYDWGCNMFCRPEDLCYRIRHMPKVDLGWWVNFVRALMRVKRRLLRGLKPVE